MEEEESNEIAQQIDVIKESLLKYTCKKRSNYKEMLSKVNNAIIFKAIISAINSNPCSMFFMISTLLEIMDILPNEFKKEEFIEVITAEMDYLEAVFIQLLLKEHVISPQHFFFYEIPESTDMTMV